MAEPLPLPLDAARCDKPANNMNNIRAEVTLHVLGTPAPQGSKSAFRNKHTGRIQQVESSKKVQPWRADVRQAVEAQAPDARFTGPVHVAVTFRFARPKGHYRTGRNVHLLRDAAPAFPAGRKDDVDKLSRAVLDAIVSAGLLEDDGFVVDLRARKVYVAAGEPPGAEITVRDLDERG